MSKKAIQNTNIWLLITLREGYLFCRNILGLWLHPFKTFTIIFTENDLSQAILILGLPLYIFGVGFLLIKTTRLIIGAPNHPWGWLAKAGGLALALGVFLLGIYLFYWAFRVYKQKKYFDGK